MTVDNPRTGRIREVPLRICSACGGTWFRVADFHAFSREEILGPFWDTWPELVGKNSQALMGVAICLCGTPHPPSLGGIRSGRTPNLELMRFMASLESAQQCLNEVRDDEALTRRVESL